MSFLLLLGDMVFSTLIVIALVLKAADAIPAADATKDLQVSKTSCYCVRLSRFNPTLSEHRVWLLTCACLLCILAVAHDVIVAQKCTPLSFEPISKLHACLWRVLSCMYVFW